MNITRALEIVADYARYGSGRRGVGKLASAKALDEALAIVEIMIAESAFFTAYQEQTVEDILDYCSGECHLEVD